MRELACNFQAKLNLGDDDIGLIFDNGLLQCRLYEVSERQLSNRGRGRRLSAEDRKLPTHILTGFIKSASCRYFVKKNNSFPLSMASDSVPAANGC